VLCLGARQVAPPAAHAIVVASDFVISVPRDLHAAREPAQAGTIGRESAKFSLMGALTGLVCTGAALWPAAATARR
jgi:hypothetical protein